MKHVTESEPLIRRRPHSLPLVASFILVVLLLASCGAPDVQPDTSDSSGPESPAGMVIVPEEAPTGMEGTWRSGISEPVDDANAVAVDGEVLWVATEGGLVRWDLRSRSSELIATAWSGGQCGTDRVSHLAVGPDGVVWASSWGARLASFDGTRWSEPEGFTDLDIANMPPKADSPLCEELISAMAFGPEGVLYLAVGETLVAYDGRTWTVTPVPADVLGESDGVDDMTVAPDGTVWAAGRTGVFSYRAGRFEWFTAADGVPPGSVGSIALAPDGYVWVAASDPGAGDPFGTPSSDPVKGGVGRYDGAAWVVYDQSDGLYATSADAIAAGADGTVWVVHRPQPSWGTTPDHPGGVSRFDGTAWTVTPIETAGDFGDGAAVDDSGTLWSGAGRGVIGFDGAEAILLRVDADTRPYIEMPHTVVEGGTDVLATTTAKPAPPVATCPAGSRPDVAGPVDQERPDQGPAGELAPVSAAAFDHESGLVIVPTDTATWAFDVCSNTFSQTSNVGVVGVWGLRVVVYDADSDLVVAWSDTVHAYDANTDTWTSHGGLPAELDQAIYDPISGLIVAWAGSSGMWAFDVDSDTWTQVSQGPISPPDAWPRILVYDADADRIVAYVNVCQNLGGCSFTWGFGGTNMTWSFDPRAGLWSVEPTANFQFGWVSLGQAAYDPAVRLSVIPACGIVAGYDLNAHEWRVLWVEDPSNCWTSLSPHNRESAWVVHDPVNERILVGGGAARMLPETTDHWVDMDDVWAFEAETGTWIELVAPSRP